MSTRTYVVVGGTRGIGYALAMDLAAAGHAVFSYSRSENPDLARVGIEQRTLDVLQEDIGSDLFPETIDGLAYCPGSINLGSFRTLKLSDFRSDFELNLMGAVKTLQATLSALKKSGSSSVVMFSTVAVQNGLGMHASIASAKGAVEGLTRSLAAELAPKIRVNAVAPALTDTSLAEKLLSNDDKRKAMAAKYAMGRVGSAEDQANLAAFLLSEKSSWITGQVFGVDGGMSSVVK